MATQSNAIPPHPVIVMKLPKTHERRREPRFGAEGEVSLMLADDPQQKEHAARLMDFSLHGLRVRLKSHIDQGTKVRIFFSWGEVVTEVMWTTPVADGFDIGLQLF